MGVNGPWIHYANNVNAASTCKSLLLLKVRPHMSINSYYVTTKTTSGRPDTRVDGVNSLQYDDGVLVLHAQNGEVLFLSPLTEVVYVKAVTLCGEPSSEPGIVCREPRGHKGDHRP